MSENRSDSLPVAYEVKTTFSLKKQNTNTMYFLGACNIRKKDSLFDVTVFLGMLRQTLMMDSKTFMDKFGYKVYYKTIKTADISQVAKLNGLGDYKWLREISKVNMNPDRLLTGKCDTVDRNTGANRIKIHLYVKKSTILWHILDNFFYNHREFVKIHPDQMRRLFIQLLIKLKPHAIKVKRLDTLPKCLEPQN